MKYTVLIIVLSVCLIGSGCLEKVLEYPKDFNVNAPATIELIVGLTGIIRSVDETARQMELETVYGFSEEIAMPPETEMSDLVIGSLAEISGVRNPATLIITAQTISIEDLTKIKIVAPEAEAVTTSPLFVDGFAKTNDQKIYWRIKDQNNAVQLSGSNTVGHDGQNYAPFHLEIFLPAMEMNNFTLEVFSKQKTVEVGLVSTPLNLLSINKSEFDVFFSNDRLNTNSTCDTVFPVKRAVAETSAVGRVSLQEILNGPTEAELYEGYRSSFPNDMVISSFTISRGAATVTVSEDLNRLNACEKQRAEEQIRQTLLQIGLVDEVQIRVE